MHHFLTSIGFGTIRTRKQLQEIIDWALEEPDYMCIVNNGFGADLAEVRRKSSAHTGIAVVGEVDEHGTVIPEYYYPFAESTHLSLEGDLGFEHHLDREAFYALSNDSRVGMPLIFWVANPSNIYKKNYLDIANSVQAHFRVHMAALASEGRIILPLNYTDDMQRAVAEKREKRRQLIENVQNGDASAMEQIARQDIREYHYVMKRLSETDVFTVVNSFFIPNGMEVEIYYIMGKILSSQLCINDLTKEKFYRLLVDTNDITMVVVINVRDLEGEPEVGRRIKCRCWMTGEVK